MHLVVTIKVAHTKEAIVGLDFDSLRLNFNDLEDRFRTTLDRVKAFPMTSEQGLKVVKTVAGWPQVREGMEARHRAELEALDRDLEARHVAYFRELGGNAYAAFNVMTDVATRPPVSFLIRRDASTLQRRAGRWLKAVQALDPSVGTEGLIQKSRTLFN